jgi:hypothetical protein
MLQHWSQVHEQAFDQFMAYKLRVPVCGAIMLNDKMDKVSLLLLGATLAKPNLVCARKRIQIFFWLGIPQRED